MCPERPSTPLRDPQAEPGTPHNDRTRQAIDRSLWRGEIPVDLMIEKQGRGLEKLMAEVQVLREELAVFKRSRDLEEEIQGEGGPRRRAEATYYDQEYAETHAAELTERQARERRVTLDRRNAAARGRRAARGAGHRPVRGQRSPVEEDEVAAAL
jgi:hypothetical protein